MNRAWQWIVTLIVIVGLFGCSQSQQPTDNLKLGEPFPAISMQRLDGANADSIKSYQGKLVVLNIWATWCEPCRREMPNLQQLSDSLDFERFAVIGLAQDEDDHLVREYLIDKDVQFASYIDSGGVIATDQLGIQLFPYTLLIAPDGRLIQRIPGPREWQRQEVIDLLENAFAGDYAGLQ